MIKAIIFDFSRVILNAKDAHYPDSLNALYKRLSQNENFNSLEHFEFNKELVDFVAGVKNQHDLYIFTTGSIQNDVHFKSVIDKIFKRIFTVEEVGFPKNNKEAYEFITNQLSLQPEEILFIDDQEENINAASESGMKAIQFVSTDQVINDIRSFL
jgi:HAD superfamily hydrolase (TIGR01549 family)